MASKHQDAANAVRNALSFLTPLQSLQDLLDRAAEAETFLAKVGPQVEKAKGEARDAQEALAAVRSALGVERERLAALIKSGAVEVKARIAEVERSLGVELAKVMVEHQSRIETMALSRQILNTSIDDLAAKKSELQSQVDSLRSEAAGLKAELTKIAQRAGGSSG